MAHEMNQIIESRKAFQGQMMQIEQNINTLLEKNAYNDSGISEIPLAINDMTGQTQAIYEAVFNIGKRIK